MSGARAIAIVGRAGRFPGAVDVETLFANVLAGRSAVRDVPADRWPARAAEIVDPAGGVDRARSARACLLEPYAFDASGLDLPQDLAERLSPLAKLTISVGRDAFADAKLDAADRERVGVVLANIALPTDGASKLAESLFFGELDERYLGKGAPSCDPLERYPSALPAGLLARALGLRAGSFTLDAACASSLYAIYLACEELESGRMDAVLAGGVSLPQALYTQVGFTQLQALSPSGRCAPFDQRADGLVVGEGAGVVVLRRLEDAVRDGQTIHAVIRGIGLSNDVGGSLLSPDTEGQLRAMRAAYTEAGWSPDDVDLVECHGTGTPRGDAVEVESLTELWQGLAPRGCVLGSVKSNVGHLLTAAGAAGLCKVLSAIASKTLPPSAHFARETASEALKKSPFRVLEAGEAWAERAAGRPRRAAVSGFGFGGINAHLLLESYVAPSRAVQRPTPRSAPAEIAVVGMATHLGPLDSLIRFQHALFRGDSVREPRPRDRWMGIPGDDLLGAWIASFAVPLGRFRIPPNELASLLPQQLLMLKVAAEAMAHHAERGAALGSGPHARAGAVVGLGLDLDTTSFHLRWLAPERVRAYAAAQGRSLSDGEACAWCRSLEAALSPALDASRTLGALGGLVASRLAREFQLGGPSFSVAGEEASGLRALEVASRLLQRGDVDWMLAGAVDLAGDVRQVLATDAMRRYAREGGAPFDARSEGVTLGEGAAAVVLKRLPDAVRDGDAIFAVLKGFGAASGANDSSGRRSAYARAMRSAHREAAVTPSDVSLVMGDGSGDPEGDADELAALTDVLGESSEPRCALAAASSVVGHAGAASGLASVVAAALSLAEGMLPPLARYRSSTCDEALRRSGVHVPVAPQSWIHDRARGSRIAGVSAMGTDGTCLHAVLAAAPASAISTASPRPLGPRSAAIFLCRGDEEELAVLAKAHVGHVEPLAAAFHRRRARTGAPVTRAFVAESVPDLIAQLARGPSRGAATPPRALEGDIAFVFPGSGNHYVGMGQTLGAALPEVYRGLEREALHLAGQLMPGLVFPHRASWEPGWEAEAAADLAGDPSRLILGQVAHGIAVHDAVRLFGVEPQAYLGYSLGESAGLFASRTWRDREVMFERTRSSALFQTELSGPCTVAAAAWGSGARWRVVIVNRSANDVRSALTGTAAILIVNAPDECVVGGDATDVAEVVERLGCGAIDLEGVPTVHLPVMAPVADAYRALHVLPATPPAGVRFYSGAWGKRYTPTSEAAADSIVANALHGFDFPKTVEAAYADGARIFVELGPQGSCTRMIHRILAGRPFVAVTACVRGQDGYQSVLSAVATLAEAGVKVSLDAIYGEGSGIADEMPTVTSDVRITVGRARPPLPPMPAMPPPINSPPLGRETDVRPPVSAPPVLAPPVFAPPVLAAPQGASLSLGPAASAAPLGALRVDGAVATARAHDVFLRLAQGSMALQTQALLEQQRLIALLVDSPSPSPLWRPSDAPSWLVGAWPAVPLAPAAPPPAFDRAMCLEFATGSLAKMLGPAFAPVDRHPSRVRLPDEPLMLCDRILSVEGEKGVLGPGRCITEHDVLPGAWYLDAGRAPVCISVEAGQADLFLSAYLGIDLETRGERVYRLLDAKIVLHRDLPRVGETIRYDIRIDRFIRHGDTWLFFFRFDGTIAGEPFITMFDGCAGFFSDEQLRSGRGIVGDSSAAPSPHRRTEDGRETEAFSPLLPPARASYGAAALEALRRGDLGDAFGPPFVGRTLAPSLRLPSGRMHLVDRIVELDTEGGAFGLGLVHGEADVTPDAWYLTCHFEGDPVMPGTLMYECCLHTLRVLLLRKGILCEEDDDALDVHYAPVVGVASQLRCRGQVLPTTKTVAYRIEIKEIGYDPEPYVLANAAMYSDDRYVVEMQNMSVRIRGLSRERLEALWAPRTTAEVYRREQILAYAEGDPSACFGEPYRPFDRDRFLARLPRPPFLLVDRVATCDAPPFVVQPTGWVECEYDIPEDAWYFAGSRQSTLPLAILVEIALQPCGFLAAYVGSALTSAEDLHFRNLDGAGTAFSEVRFDAGTLTMRTRLTKASEAGGMLLESFDFEIWQAGRKVYAGHTGFGFFAKAALAAQVGVRGAKLAELPAGARAFALPKDGPEGPGDCARFGTPKHVGLTLPARAFLMVDEIEALALAGGPKGLGFISGKKQVSPEEWFFEAHFYQDPVMPGSLGLEALVQLLRVFVRERFGDLVDTHRVQCFALDRPHRWQYRGQVAAGHRTMTVQAWITRIEEGEEPVVVADGQLAVDGRVIYTMSEFSMRLVRRDDIEGASS